MESVTMELTKVEPANIANLQENRDLLAMDVDGLKAEFANCFSVTVARIKRMAVCVTLLESKGVDVSDVPMVHRLRLIASGQLLADLEYKYQGRGNILNRVAGLPLKDQQRLLSDEPLEVYTLEGGQPSFRHVKPVALGFREALQVFAVDHIRNEAEQIAYIRAKLPVTPPSLEPQIVVDQKRKGIIACGIFISRAELAGYLARISE